MGITFPINYYVVIYGKKDTSYEDNLFFKILFRNYDSRFLGEYSSVFSKLNGRRKHLQLLSRITLLGRACQNTHLFNLCCMFFSPPMSFQGTQKLTQKLFTRLSYCFKRACNLCNVAFNVL